MVARLADIAAQAGVSEATVSRVLNSRPGVSDSTRQSVLTALDVLGYERPTRLRQHAAGLVGLLLPDLDDPVHPAFVQAVEPVLARQGYTVALCTGGVGGVGEDESVRMLLERGACGIVLVAGAYPDLARGPTRYQALRALGLPIVLVDGYLDGVDAPFVSSDDAAATDLAVTHLAALGHTRIGLAAGPRRSVPAVRRIAAFTAALTRLLDVPDPAGWVESLLPSLEGGALAADRLVARGATALVCASDLMALGAVRAVRARGLSVPADVSVVGSGDSPLLAFTDPPLTTVRRPVAAMAAAAVQALLDELEGAPAASGEYLFAPELVVRSSTGAAPPSS